METIHNCPICSNLDFIKIKNDSRVICADIIDDDKIIIIQIVSFIVTSSFIFLQFVNAQSYQPNYEYEDEYQQYKDSEYSNYPDFGLRESAVVKLNNPDDQVNQTKYTTPRRTSTRRTTIYSRNGEPTQRVLFIPTTPRNKPHAPAHTSNQFNKNDFVFVNEIENTKNLTTSEEVQTHVEELNIDKTTHDKSESSSSFIETTYKIDHTPYSNGGYNKQITNHNFDTKNLFSTDVSAKKIQKPNGSGYFEANGKYDLSKLSNRYINHLPIHEKLKTDLAVIDLQLQSYPRPLKNFKHQHLPHSHFARSPEESKTTSTAATLGQIKLYNDDIKKYYDQILEEQLRTSKDPADKAKYHLFIKAMEDEKIEQQSTSIRDLERRRPIKAGSRLRPNNQYESRIKSPEKTFGLSYFKTLGTPLNSERPYKFPFL